MSYGLRAQRQNKDYVSKRNGKAAGKYPVSYNAGVNKIQKRFLHKSERRKNKIIDLE